jgi:hypothetical protein
VLVEELVLRHGAPDDLGQFRSRDARGGLDLLIVQQAADVVLVILSALDAVELRHGDVGAGQPVELGPDVLVGIAVEVGCQLGQTGDEPLVEDGRHQFRPKLHRWRALRLKNPCKPRGPLKRSILED